VQSGDRPIGGIADTDRRLSREALNFGGKNAGHICARARGRAPNPSRSVRTGSVGKFSIYQLVGSRTLNAMAATLSPAWHYPGAHWLSL